MPDRIDHGRRRLVRGAAMTLAATRLGMIGAVMQQLACALAVEGNMPSLDGATGWLNSPRLTTDALRGKVVVVQFCTYSCINWLRTLPYVRAWDDKYRGRGLVTLGVHSPEFEFEKDVDGVRKALTGMRVTYPIAIDSDLAVWRAFGNEYWPALYMVDAQGRIRHHHFGEGEYEWSEQVVQRLLAEAGVADVGRDLVEVEGRGVEQDADWGSLRSQEAYVGYARAENFASPGGLASDRRSVYAAPKELRLGQWGMSGDWTVGPQAAVLNQPGGRIACGFHARDLHLVMGPAARGAAVRFRVAIDGKPPGRAHGLDVDEQGNGVTSEQRLHQLIRQPKPIDDRRFEIEFLDPGAAAYSFTFG